MPRRFLRWRFQSAQPLPLPGQQVRRPWPVLPGPAGSPGAPCGRGTERTLIQSELFQPPPPSPGTSRPGSVHPEFDVNLLHEGARAQQEFNPVEAGDPVDPSKPNGQKWTLFLKRSVTIILESGCSGKSQLRTYFHSFVHRIIIFKGM